MISIAIELERISRHLRELPVVRNGTAFIIDRNGQPVAFKDPSEVVQAPQNGSEPRRRRLEESRQPQLRIAQQAKAGKRVALAGITHPRQLVFDRGDANGRYFVTLAPIGHKDWLIGTVIPENDFLTKINANWRRPILAVLGAMPIVGAAAILLARHQFIAPPGEIVRQTHEVERFNLAAVRQVPTNIREIHDLSTASHHRPRRGRQHRLRRPPELHWGRRSDDLASRLEGMSKNYGTELIISQTIYELAKYDIVARRPDVVTVKSRDEPVKIYELLAMADESGETPGYEWVRVFEHARDLYQAKDWAGARRGFEQVIELRGDDRPSRVFLDRLGERASIEAELPLLQLANARRYPAQLCAKILRRPSAGRGNRLPQALDQFGDIRQLRRLDIENHAKCPALQRRNVDPRGREIDPAGIADYIDQAIDRMQAAQ